LKNYFCSGFHSFFFPGWITGGDGTRFCRFLDHNLIHHKGLSVALYVLGYLLANSVLQFAGTLLLGHSSLDRVFGYGLKYPDAFKNTHLGVSGRSN